MAIDYAAIAADVLEQIAEAGQAVTIKVPTAGIYDADTDTRVPGETTLTGVGVLLDYKLQQAGVREAAESLVQVGDKKLLLATQGITVEPPPGARATVAGVTYRVLNTRAVAPAGVAVLYELHLRR